MEIPFLKKKMDYNRASVISSIRRKIVVCDIEYCNKNITKIRNVHFRKIKKILQT